MSEQHILLDETDHVATITLNRPERMNAFGGRIRQGLVESLDAVKLNADVHVLETLRKTQDVAEGIAAFLEKRDPHFEGR